MWRLIFWDEESRTGDSGNGHRPDEPQIFHQILPSGQNFLKFIKRTLRGKVVRMRGFGVLMIATPKCQAASTPNVRLTASQTSLPRSGIGGFLRDLPLGDHQSRGQRTVFQTLLLLEIAELRQTGNLWWEFCGSPLPGFSSANPPHDRFPNGCYDCTVVPSAAIAGCLGQRSALGHWQHCKSGSTSTSSSRSVGDVNCLME
jgi:hypothetical protein